jgi:hypothetical protein
VFDVPPGLGMKTVYTPSRSWGSLGLPKDQKKRVTTLPECLRGGTFEGKNPSPEEANTRVRLSILYSVPIVNK